MKNILGSGQEKVKDQDGFFTTFTTKNNKKYIEYKQNLKSSWNNNPYWDRHYGNKSDVELQQCQSF